MLGAALLWSTGGIGIKEISEPPLKVAFYRSLFAAAALFLILRPRVRRWSPAFLAALASYAACLDYLRRGDEMDDGRQRDLPSVRRRRLGAAPLPPGPARAAAMARRVRGRRRARRDGALLRRPFRGGREGRRDGARLELASSPGLVLSLGREAGIGRRRPRSRGATSSPSPLSSRSSPGTSPSRRARRRSSASSAIFQLACAYILFVRGLQARHGDAGLAHRNARAGRESDLGIPVPGRASGRVRDPRAA